MKLSNLKCPSCSAVVNINGDESIVTCEYCQNKIHITKPLDVNNIVDGLNELEQNKYSNYVTLLNQAMNAGNYIEAYEYCNKALEINPNSSQIWENKAICTFWNSSIENLEEKAGEIISYLNASRQIDNNNSSLLETSKSIGENLFHMIRYKYNNRPKGRLPNGKYEDTLESENIMISCFRLFEMCYQINPDSKYLEKSISLMIEGFWVMGSSFPYQNSYIANRHNFDASRRIDILKSKISKLRPEYDVPKKQIDSQKIAVLIVSAFLIIMFIIFVVLGKK